MALGHILRCRTPLNRCLQQWNNNRAYQHFSGLQQLVGIRSAPRLCLSQEKSNPVCTQSRSLCLSRTLHQEGPNNPLEPTAHAKAKSSNFKTVLGSGEGYTSEFQQKGPYRKRNVILLGVSSLMLPCVGGVALSWYKHYKELTFKEKLAAGYKAFGYLKQTFCQKEVMKKIRHSMVDKFLGCFKLPELKAIQSKRSRFAQYKVRKMARLRKRLEKGRMKSSELYRNLNQYGKPKRQIVLIPSQTSTGDEHSHELSRTDNIYKKNTPQNTHTGLCDLENKQRRFPFNVRTLNQFKEVASGVKQKVKKAASNLIDEVECHKSSPPVLKAETAKTTESPSKIDQAADIKQKIKKSAENITEKNSSESRMEATKMSEFSSKVEQVIDIASDVKQKMKKSAASFMEDIDRNINSPRGTQSTKTSESPSKVDQIKDLASGVKQKVKKATSNLIDEIDCHKRSPPVIEAGTAKLTESPSKVDQAADIKQKMIKL